MKKRLILTVDSAKGFFKDENIYYEAFFWCIPIIIISMIVGWFIYKRIKKRK